MKKNRLRTRILKSLLVLPIVILMFASNIVLAFAKKSEYLEYKISDNNIVSVKNISQNVVEYTYNFYYYDKENEIIITKHFDDIEINPNETQILDPREAFNHSDVNTIEFKLLREKTINDSSDETWEAASIGIALIAISIFAVPFIIACICDFFKKKRKN